MYVSWYCMVILSFMVQAIGMEVPIESVQIACYLAGRKPQNLNWSKGLTRCTGTATKQQRGSPVSLSHYLQKKTGGISGVSEDVHARSNKKMLSSKICTRYIKISKVGPQKRMTSLSLLASSNPTEWHWAFREMMISKHVWKFFHAFHQKFMINFPRFNLKLLLCSKVSNPARQNWDQVAHAKFAKLWEKVSH